MTAQPSDLALAQTLRARKKIYTVRPKIIKHVLVSPSMVANWLESNQRRKLIQTIGQLFSPIVTATAVANNVNN